MFNVYYIWFRITFLKSTISENQYFTLKNQTASKMDALHNKTLNRSVCSVKYKLQNTTKAKIAVKSKASEFYAVR